MKNLFDPVAFGERLQAAIERRNMSLRRAQVEIGVDHSTIARTLHGQPPNVENYARIKAWLDAEVNK